MGRVVTTTLDYSQSECSNCHKLFSPETTRVGKPYRTCVNCRAVSARHESKHRSGNPEWNTKMRAYHRSRRQKVYDHYGNKCECCGETRYEFLSMDHINGGGTQHRKVTGSRGSDMIGWIIRNDYPDTFRVLCHNCNQAIGFYGACPHELEK